MMNGSKTKLQFVKSYWVFVVLWIFFISTSVAVQARDSDATKSLLKSIEQTRQQLATERKRIKSEEKSQKKDLQESTIRQEQLIDEIVERKFAIAGREVQLEKKRSACERLRQQQGRFKQQRAEIGIITADASQKLSDLLDILPPSESRLEQKKLLAEVKSSAGESGQIQTNMSTLLELLSSLLCESRTSSIFRRNIRNAQGYEQQVQLLRVGQIFFAYRSLSSGQTAIASATSLDEKGFRWNEDIPKWARQKIDLVIDSVSSKSGVYFLPIDVSQQLSSDISHCKCGFWNKLVAGGPVMIPLGIVAFLALVLIFERFVFLFSQSRGTVAIAEDILAACHAKDFQKAEAIAVQKSVIISRTLLACLSRRLEGTAAMEDAVAESVLHELPKLERFLPSIGILAGVAPLLGLLGTVTGMISTFDTITIFGSGQPRLMAGGISEALLTTATGLSIAIPVLLIHSFLCSRTDKLVADTERFSATLLNLLREPSSEPSKHETGRRGVEDETTD
jgi:biopolymer transport protein ExbB